MDTRKLIEETQRIANAAYYETNGRRIIFEDPDGLSTACVYNPTFIKECVDNMRRAEAEEHQRTEYVVAQDDSFVAARLYGSGKTIVLNFANAYHPGGGFLAGSTAQEEMLCRCSTLYKSLSSDSARELYDYNRSHHGPDCSDYVIISPHVAVFRDVDYSLLDEPLYTAVLTSAAPNRYVEEKSLSEEQIRKIFERKIENILALAAHNRYETIVLGAWGCGAFGNDAHDVAQYFYQKLVVEKYDRFFRRVIFSIYVSERARNLYSYNAFQTAFAGFKGGD